ncbi:hypothetical protein LVJ94_28995 [Pendulispora rubella]|uniref:Uncharacterized protein n=1 Tax=Pendulispora rubella TaxID=2741070 RepID=A0ABZ2KT98_9BACT
MNRARSVLFLIAAAAVASGCGLFVGVDWDRVSAKDGTEDGGGHPGPGGNGEGNEGGTKRPLCVPPKVACIAGCCDDNGDKGLPASVAAGGGMTCATSSTGKVFCWGHNLGGELGRGKGPDSYVPVMAYNIPSGATQVAVSGIHGCAVVDRLVGCWGANASGQLGFEWTEAGRTAGYEEPGRVQNIEGTKLSVTVGDQHGCALVDGTAYCWGSNGEKQLAIDDIYMYISYKPLTISQIGSQLRAISAGGEHSTETCAIVSNGGVMCWGRNNLPATIQRVANASMLAVGGNGSCAVENGQAKCWSGPNGEGLATPEGLPSGVTSISAGRDHWCAVINGEAWCWGGNIAGQLGRGTTSHGELAAKVPNLSGVESISAGNWHTCALLTNKTLRCWGYNAWGQLGNGTKDDSPSPVPVKWP